MPIKPKAAHRFSFAIGEPALLSDLFLLKKLVEKACPRPGEDFKFRGNFD
jgi:hypothetical protein